MSSTRHLDIVQLFEKETSTYSYLIYDEHSKEAAIIDPVDINFERDCELIEKLDIKLKYSLETHIHADHLSAGYLFKERFNSKIAISSESKSQCADILLKDNDKLSLGTYTIKCIYTPGHTNTCMSYYYLDECIFTGDALLIGGCGRTDFQDGSSEKLFDSIRNKIFLLPDETIIYPGHDYKGFSKSSMRYEKKYNTRLKLSNSFGDFKNIMDNLNLAEPKKIKESVPANMNCGRKT